ncbi:MAG: DUF1080 domain-containing protein, partial [Salinivirgaceae bacterium]|nr:DUF1080 domain-containing protein [Salinivirgaceae bacterium]
MKFLFYSLSIFMASIFSVHAGESNWVELFNGKNLKGWKANENPGGFRVENGLLVCSGERGHLFYEGNKPFKNFELIAEIKTAPFANSGIFFHASPQEKGWLNKGYEVQVNNTYYG